MIKVGIIGGSGYTAGELIRILMFHPNATLDFVYSTTNAGKPLSFAHHDLMGVGLQPYGSGGTDLRKLPMQGGQPPTVLKRKAVQKSASNVHKNNIINVR